MARDPVWAPDGRSLLILGRRDRTSPLAEVFDWWWVPLDGRPPIKTGVLGFPSASGTEASPESWTTSGVVFSARGDLWSVPVSISGGRAVGPPRRLTAGTGEPTTPTVSRDGMVVFGVAEKHRVVERAPLGEGKENQPPVRLYADNRGTPERASETADGSVIVFEQGFSKYREIWLKNLRTERQQMVLRIDHQQQVDATVSPDGARVVYTVGAAPDGGTGQGVEIAGGVPRAVCEDCGLHGFLSDNHRALAVWDGQHTIGTIDVTNGSKVELIRNREGAINRPHVSPDDRWLAFRRVVGTAAKTYVTSLAAGRLPSPAMWQEVQEPTVTGRPTGWSLDSRVLYLLLDTDGFRCLWGQRIDPATGRLSGIPFPVRHFHDNNNLGFAISTSYGNPITTDGFLYENIDTTGNLWRLVAPTGTHR